MTLGSRDRLLALLDEHREERFPAAVERGREYNGVELVLADADVFGWAITATGGRLSANQRQGMAELVESLESALSAIPTEGRGYFERLVRIAKLVLEDVFPCVCCGYLVLSEAPGSYDICPICFWEDDLVQLRWPDFGGGANRYSLIEAQQSFRLHGVSEMRLLRFVRPPSQGESREAGWRPVDAALDAYERDGSRKADWPTVATDLYWWRPSYWLR